MYIDLSYNNLLNIHDAAFEGVETAVTILKLNNNDLDVLPAGIANLTSLVYLDVQFNPIKTFDNHVLWSIGSHLEVFSLGSGAMTEWPQEFENLTQLNTLHMFDLPFEIIPDSAFGSFAGTLKSLVIVNSSLSSVPAAICDLRSMYDFQFIHNTNLNESGMIMPNCMTPLTNVTSAKFDGNDLTEFPDVFQIFPSLHSLYIVDNPNLTSINAGVIPNNSTITNLYLYNNDLHSVPAELKLLQGLRYLDIHGNKISILIETDVAGLHELLLLNLNDNPLFGIEISALQNLTKLLSLSLDNTDITEIPEAINGSVSLHTVSIKKDKINCSCETLKWIKDWQNLNSLIIAGTCDSPNHGEKIADYLNYQLPNC